MPKKQHIDKTSAEDKSIGFDFQYYYFLLKLLQLKKGETLGLEVMDDVHCSLSNDRQILVQLKFTTQTKKGGEAKNLTTLDTDFWKTASNWVKVITDKNADRSNENEQLKFAERTEFLLCSNKSDNAGNDTLGAIREFQAGKKKHAELLALLLGLHNSSSSDVVTGYINDVLSLSSSVSKAFFTNIAFDLGCADIIQTCKERILGFAIAAERVDDVFYSLDSQLRADNFDLVVKKQKIEITYNEFLEKYRVHFDKARNGQLIVRQNFTPLKEIGDQLFVKQLIDIGDVSPEETEHILQMLHNQLLAKTNLEEWLHKGDITRIDAKELEDDAVTNWKNLHRQAYRNIAADDDVDIRAQDLVDELRREKLSIANQDMNRSFSNGEYYDLCEQRKIGWRHDWENRYK